MADFLAQEPPHDVPGVPNPPEPRYKQIIKKILFIGLPAVLVIGGLVWWLFGSGNGKNLSVSIELPGQVQTGVPVELSVNATNNSGNELKDVQISVSLPAGFQFIGIPGRRTAENRQIGALPAGKLHKETFLVMATENQNSVLSVKASVSYLPGGLSSRFEKIVTQEVVVGEGGIELNVTPPSKAFGGEEFVTEISYKNLSAYRFEGVELKLTYPQGYTFKSATQAAADSNNTTWKIDALPPAGAGMFKVTGYLVGQDNANFEIKAVMSAAVGESSYPVAESVATIAMEPSPLSIRISVNNDNGAVFSPGDQLRYRIEYANNTQIALRDVIIRAKLIGEMFDMKTLKTEGVLRSSDNTISWNAATVPLLANLPAGASGNLSFELGTKATYPITRLSSKNYVLTVHAEIESPTVPRNVTADKTLGIAELTNKMRGALIVGATGYFRDTAASIANQGPFPPKVGQSTQFTIHWILKNTSTDVEQIHLGAFLGPNVRYTGVYKTNVASSTPSYNERTQEMTWDISKIQATRGILSPALELTFQVELTPSANQVRTYPELVQTTNVSYKDTFTGESLTTSALPVSTRLPDDPTVQNVDRAVQE